MEYERKTSCRPPKQLPPVPVETEKIPVPAVGVKKVVEQSLVDEMTLSRSPSAGDIDTDASFSRVSEMEVMDATPHKQASQEVPLSALKEAFDHLDTNKEGLAHNQFEQLLTSWLRLSVSEEQVSDEELKIQTGKLWSAMGKDAKARVLFEDVAGVLTDESAPVEVEESEDEESQGKLTSLWSLPDSKSDFLSPVSTPVRYDDVVRNITEKVSLEAKTKFEYNPKLAKNSHATKHTFPFEDEHESVTNGHSSNNLLRTRSFSQPVSQPEVSMNEAMSLKEEVRKLKHQLATVTKRAEQMHAHAVAVDATNTQLTEELHQAEQRERRLNNSKLEAAKQGLEAHQANLQRTIDELRLEVEKTRAREKEQQLKVARLRALLDSQEEDSNSGPRPLSPLSRKPHWLRSRSGPNLSALEPLEQPAEPSPANGAVVQPDCRTFIIVELRAELDTLRQSHGQLLQENAELQRLLTAQSRSPLPGTPFPEEEDNERSPSLSVQMELSEMQESLRDRQARNAELEAELTRLREQQTEQQHTATPAPTCCQCGKMIDQVDTVKADSACPSNAQGNKDSSGQPQANKDSSDRPQTSPKHNTETNKLPKPSSCVVKAERKAEKRKEKRSSRRKVHPIPDKLDRSVLASGTGDVPVPVRRGVVSGGEPVATKSRRRSFGGFSSPVAATQAAGSSKFDDLSKRVKHWLKCELKLKQKHKQELAQKDFENEHRVLQHIKENEKTQTSHLSELEDLKLKVGSLNAKVASLAAQLKSKEQSYDNLKAKHDNLKKLSSELVVNLGTGYWLPAALNGKMLDADGKSFSGPPKTTKTIFQLPPLVPSAASSSALTPSSSFALPLVPSAPSALTTSATSSSLPRSNSFSRLFTSSSSALPSSSLSIPLSPSSSSSLPSSPTLSLPLSPLSSIEDLPSSSFSLPLSPSSSALPPSSFSLPLPASSSSALTPSKPFSLPLHPSSSSLLTPSSAPSPSRSPLPSPSSSSSTTPFSFPSSSPPRTGSFSSAAWPRTGDLLSLSKSKKFLVRARSMSSQFSGKSRTGNPFAA